MEQTQEQEYVAVARAEDLAPGEMLEVDVMGEEVALFNVDGTFYAIGNICTHAYTHLTEGDFYEDMRGDWVVECSLHGSTFDVTTGEATTLPATGNAGKFDVKVEDGQVYVSTRPVVRYHE